MGDECGCTDPPRLATNESEEGFSRSIRTQVVILSFLLSILRELGHDGEWDVLFAQVQLLRCWFSTLNNDLRANKLP